MYLHPTDLRLGHNSILKQLIEVFVILNKPLLVHFEKLRSSLVLLKITFPKCWKPPQHQGDHDPFVRALTLTARLRGRRGHICAGCNETRKKEKRKVIIIWANVHGSGAFGEEKRNLIQRKIKSRNKKYSEKLYM